MVRVAINGFGRIGRLVLRAGFEDVDIVAINDLGDARTMAHLLKNDTVHGKFDASVDAGENCIYVNGKEITLLSEKDPSKLPWGDMGIDVVIESTGLFRTREKASMHLHAGAKKVIISAPAKGGEVKTIVKGVNEHTYDPSEDDIISNASCTTNCLAPIAKILQDNYGIEKGFMTTVHAVTNDQKILDLPHKDLRRARASGWNIIPTTTGAAQAVGLVIPELQGKLDGIAMRVPVMDGSVVDLVVELGTQASADQINGLIESVATHHMPGVLEYSKEPLVSSDIVKNPHSCIFDSQMTKVMEGRFVKLIMWYDNEWGYSNRMVDLVKIMASHM